MSGHTPWREIKHKARGPIEFWGVDLETSGTTRRHVPIQLGICSPSGETRSWLIKGWSWDAWKWDDEAAEVHGITKERLEDEGQYAYDVADEAARFVHAYSGTYYARRKPTGWNVAKFDMPYIDEHLIRLANTMSYQGVDLAAVVFAMSVAFGVTFGADPQTIKADAKAHAKKELKKRGVQTAEHDAGYDAAEAVLVWQYLTERMEAGY